MEAMACGLAVVVPQEGGACSFARDGINALVIDTTDANARRQAVQRLLDDVDLRRRLSLQALRDLPAFHPEGCALRILDALLRP
jgi:glycosyltransferase involved in cell wall biosynthesis